MGTDSTVHLAGKAIQSSCHACAFFHTREEELRVLLPFVREGLENGEKNFHIVDEAHREDRLKNLEELPFDIERATQSGQLEVRGWNDAYLRPGHFDQYAMLRLIEEVLQDGRAKEYPITRLWANMEWALKELPGVEDLVEYETRLNQVLPKYDDVVVCTYDLTRFSAQTVMDIMRTHPMVIVGGTLQENPFFMPPEAFLEELRDRRVSA